MNSNVDRILAQARQAGASDVHLKVGQPPILRISGKLHGVKGFQSMTQEVLNAYALGMMNPRQRGIFEEMREVDLAYSPEPGQRYRVNVFQQRGFTGMVLRVIPSTVPTFKVLGLPPVVLTLADRPRGLILVTGVTGSGKSTTLASMVEHINTSKSCHIITIEDPIEYELLDKKSLINQRELGLDTTTFSSALRSALRQDPDVVLVGEMRDLETIEIALTAAETGHLVLSTLHTADAVETVNRIISVFPPHHQQQIRVQLASVLIGVVSQRLIERSDGKGRIPASEVLVVNQRARELILDETRARELRDVIAQGSETYGMVSFDQSLTALVQSGAISYEAALANATNGDDFALYYRGITEGTHDAVASDWAEKGQYRDGAMPMDGIQLDD
ncbi:MAG: type IV pilus twitching motility protein PilT [Deltaproteobacteria bacterium]|nr:type IV pilus twitching motility protein PilT [Deltaproteobacteria bacterium]